MANYEHLLAKVEQQEQRFQFKHFNHNDTWKLGNEIVAIAQEKNLNLPLVFV